MAAVTQQWRPLVLTEETNGRTQLPAQDWKMIRGGEERSIRDGRSTEEEPPLPPHIYRSPAREIDGAIRRRGEKRRRRRRSRTR